MIILEIASNPSPSMVHMIQRMGEKKNKKKYNKKPTQTDKKKVERTVNVFLKLK